MFEKLKESLYDTWLDINKEIKNDKYSFILYIIAITYLVISEQLDLNHWHQYIALFIMSIGCILWSSKYYNGVKEKPLIQLVLFIVFTFSLYLSYLLSDFAITEQTGLPSKDFPNTDRLIQMCTYIIILSLLFSIGGIITLVTQSMSKNKNPSQNKIKELFLLFHLAGIFSIVIISMQLITQLERNNSLLINIIYTLDYKYLYNYPDIDKRQKVAIHDGNYYSIMKENDNGEKYIILYPIESK